MSNGFAASRLISLHAHTSVQIHNPHRFLSLNYRLVYAGSCPYFQQCRYNSQLSPMTSTNGAQTPETAPRKLKILMLHGYTQSGPLFHAKTRALEKLLIKSFPPSPPAPHRPSPLQQIYPGGPQLIYPTAPIRLFPADIPGYEASTDEEKEQPDVWGWWKRETGSGRYAGLEEGLDRIAESIQEVGGIDGVIGFSQGAAAAGMVASLLQPGRQTAFSSQTQTNPESFPYPKSWEPLQQLHPEGLKFAVSYSGFYAPNSLYTAFYEPKITSPFLHFIGSLDSVVEESRSLALVGVCEKGSGRTVYHPGGHFVPVGKEWGGVLVGFIRECIEPKMKEEDVADMDVSF